MKACPAGTGAEANARDVANDPDSSSNHTTASPPCPAKTILVPTLADELRAQKPGARVVSHVFNMGPEWPPAKQFMVGRSPVFFWTIPER